MRYNYIGILLALAISLAALTSNLPVAGPMIQSDEGSYLHNAAAIAGYTNDFANSHHAGYSILLVPAFWIGETPQSIWFWVKAINAFLVFVTVWLLWWLSVFLMPQISNLRRSLGVLISAIYPAGIVLSGYCFAQIALIPCFLATFACLLLALRSGPSGNPYPWLGAGLFAGFAYWIHPVGIVVTIGLFISLAYLTWTSKNFLKYSTLLILASIAVIIAYKYLFSPWLLSRMTTSGLVPNLHYSSVPSLASAFSSYESIFKLLVRFSGTIFYITIGTVGLFWVGFFQLGLAYGSHNRLFQYISRSYAIAIFIFLTACVLGASGLGALLFTVVPEATRFDHFMYGRYVEPFIYPILLLGALASSSRSALIAIPIACGSCFLLYFGLSEYTNTAYFNIPAFWQAFYLPEHQISVAFGVGISLLLIFAILPSWLGKSMVIAVFMFSSGMQIKWHNAASKNAIEKWRAALKARESYPKDHRIGFDFSGINSYNRHTFWYDFGFVLYDYKLTRLNISKSESIPEIPIFSYENDLDLKNPDFELMTKSPHGGPNLWVPNPGSQEKVNLNKCITVDRDEPVLHRLLSSGWHAIEKTFVWSSESSRLKIKASWFEENRLPSEIVMKLSAFGASPSRPVHVQFATGVNMLDYSFKDSSPREIVIPLPQNNKLAFVEITVPEAVSPVELIGTKDSRRLGVALHGVEFRNSVAGETPNNSNEVPYPIIFGGKGNGVSNLLTGWHQQEAEFTWSTAEATLQLPLPEKFAGQDFPVVLKFFVFGASPQRPVDVLFESADPDWKWEHKLTTTEAGNLELKVPLPAGKSPRTIKISIPQAISPSELLGSPDPRILGIALRSVENEEPSIKK